MKDCNGVKVKMGDIIEFSYGAPPVVVKSRIASINGELFALTPLHNPTRCRLRNLRRHIGDYEIVGTVYETERKMKIIE